MCLCAINILHLAEAAVVRVGIGAGCPATGSISSQVVVVWVRLCAVAVRRGDGLPILIII